MNRSELFDLIDRNSISLSSSGTIIQAVYEYIFTDGQKIIALIDYMGDLAFPQYVEEMSEKFGEPALMSAINNELIQESFLGQGVRPDTMAAQKRYIELTVKGREVYEEIKNKK